MRTYLTISLYALCALAALYAQPRPADDPLVGTWTGPVHCEHGGGDRFTMTIARDESGTFIGTMDWALATSDGRNGPAIAFTTLVVEGTTLAATGKVGERTAYLKASLEGATLKGSWQKDDDDTWTFAGKKR